MIKEGTQVVCVDDTFNRESIKAIPNRPVRNSIYTVREVRYYNLHDKVGILLEEIKNPKNVRDFWGTTQEPSFNIIRFVPLNKVLDKITIEEIQEIAI